MKTFDIYAYKELELYGSVMPETEDDLLQIKQLGIDIIISLDEGIQEHPNYKKLKTDFEHYELIITDYDIPKNEHIEQFLAIVSKAIKEKKKVLVHCWAGCGRTGLMLALAERFVYGTLDGEKAIKMVRKIRPCAIETQNQYNLILEYERTVD
ncbi:MAG: protein-tyrosine phosphatase family protein [Candidatus Heimdallarchaeota archaeon]